MRVLKTEEEKRIKNLERVKRNNRLLLKQEGEANLTIENCRVLAMTQEETAGEMNVTRQCVQQTERRALVKIRKLWRLSELEILKLNLNALALRLQGFSK